ncbi:hypothetical protein HXX02_07905 [Microbulbifer elongatus]|uniref:Integron gene cassette protein n=1 Tax=Microbulbifer elongatus TaxID=86173 RepID=A0ABT1P1H2_9GAMM|nr:hypothetical protein [Microbulbifer elongatus]MCQ3829367.1 hypothetical protein [Microbulbifer elongatus]
MNQLITIKTSKFDVSKEDENPNNQIYGQSLLVWLRESLKEKFEFSEVDSEDWGWYCFVSFYGRKYMLGATAFFEDGEDPKQDIEWAFQVDKERTWKEILLLQEKMTASDQCFQFFKEFFRGQHEMKVLSTAENA